MANYKYADDSDSTHHKGRAHSILNWVLQFWFKPSDLTTIAAMRICAGSLFLFILLIYAFDLHKLLGNHAWIDAEMLRLNRYENPTFHEVEDWVDDRRIPLPTDPVERAKWNEYSNAWEADERLVYAKGMPTWSIWYHVTDPMWMNFTHGLIILTTFLFTIGFCTRITAPLVWLASVSYVNRATTTYFGMDTMMNLLLIYMMVAGICGAAGGALSVDRLIMQWWTRKAGGLRLDADPNPLAFISANFVTRLVQINFCIIYIASGLSKLQGASWWNGRAFWGVTANPEFNPMDFGPYMAFLSFLCSHRWLFELCTHGFVLLTLFMEISFCYLVWLPKWRWLMIIGAVMLHTGIALVMGLVGFSLAMLTLLLAFVPPETMRRMVNVLQEQFRPLTAMVTHRIAPEKQAVLLHR
jgi:hypothetical protein